MSDKLPLPVFMYMSEDILTGDRYRKLRMHQSEKDSKETIPPWGKDEEQVDLENGTSLFPHLAAQHHMYKMAFYKIDIDHEAYHPMCPTVM